MIINSLRGIGMDTATRNSKSFLIEKHCFYICLKFNIYKSNDLFLI